MSAYITKKKLIERLRKNAATTMKSKDKKRDHDNVTTYKRTLNLNNFKLKTIHKWKKIVPSFRFVLFFVRQYNISNVRNIQWKPTGIKCLVLYNPLLTSIICVRHEIYCSLGWGFHSVQKFLCLQNNLTSKPSFDCNKVVWKYNIVLYCY